MSSSSRRVMQMLRDATAQSDKSHLGERGARERALHPDRAEERVELAVTALAKELGLDFLTVKEVVLMHAELIDRYGGAHGVRDAGLLESAVMRPLHAACYDESLAHDAPRLAASLAYGLVTDHVFVDGNKRIGFAAAGVFLAKNGYDYAPDPTEALRVFRAVASDRMDEETLGAWMRRVAVPRERPTSEYRRPAP